VLAPLNNNLSFYTKSPLPGGERKGLRWIIFPAQEVLGQIDLFAAVVAVNEGPA
jgi:hypothetical protein